MQTLFACYHECVATFWKRRWKSFISRHRTLQNREHWMLGRLLSLTTGVNYISFHHINPAMSACSNKTPKLWTWNVWNVCDGWICDDYPGTVPPNISAQVFSHSPTQLYKYLFPAPLPCCSRGSRTMEKITNFDIYFFLLPWSVF